MKTAFIFPGLNGLLRKTDRLRFLDWPEFHHFAARAEAVVKKDFSRDFRIQDFLQSSTEEIYNVKNVSLAAVAIVSIQCAVAERLLQRTGAPDWVMGCSLGDLARSIFAGAYPFEDAVFNHIFFTQSIDGIDQIGGNVGVLAPKNQIFTAADYQAFNEMTVDVSRLTPRFLNVGGRFEDLQKLRALAKLRGWSVMGILDYPAHSRYILPYVQKVSADVLRVNTSKPLIPMFSSFSARPLEDPEEIKQEFLLSITKTIHWSDAVCSLVRDHGVEKFINIGPCRSLSGMMPDIPVQVECVDAWSLL